ncbi:4a-hydroxytetrahydrobiopterin dehydratase [Cellulomonas sp. NS3]|uniref:4a-hydroxytetrahydrobiopterin dehydratase n=1 Tax=Cellulomonas sp. NS3 TaxID=2973977 RepID=UPI0021622A04|nr:VOC family protein [Cellulomonas sp. NS3]
MTERISPRQVAEAHGLDDWRVLPGGVWACAHFRTSSFSVGAALVQAISAAATTVNRHPDVDLRPEGVTVRLRGDEPEGFRTRDLDLARTISAAARALDAHADPAAVQHVQVALEALAAAQVRPFWRAVLGYQDAGDADLVDPLRRGPSWTFPHTDDREPQRDRPRAEVQLAADQLEERVAAAVAAGGRVVSDARAPQRWTLADPEGSEVDLTVWTP